MQFPVQYPFQGLIESRGYNLFPQELEYDPLVFFHGTKEANYQSIVVNDFWLGSKTRSVSFARKSADTLIHVFKEANPLVNDAYILAVRFYVLDLHATRKDGPYLQLDKVEVQPEGIGFCIIPVGTRYA